MQRQESFDLIVLGAGPAGAACARTAAKLGLSVALVDKARFPRDKLCGGGLSGRATKHYARIFDRPLPDVPLAKRDAITFCAFGEPLIEDLEAPVMHLAMRHAFDASLVAAALEAGAQDFMGRTGTIDLDGPAYDLDDLRLVAPLIVAADGVNSATAKLLFGTSFDREKIGFALEIEHPHVSPDTPLRIDFGAADWGYGWQFPKAHGTTIGVGGVLSRNADMKAAMSDYLERLGLDPSLKAKGQFLPFGDFRETPGKGRVLLAGDAAGLVDPITGEGIAHALHSGELAAIAVAEALAKNAPDSALARYKRALKPIHSGLRQARWLRQIMFREGFRETFIKRFRRSKGLKTDYLRLLAGETEYGEIMRKMALRLPRYAMGLLRGH